VAGKLDFGSPRGRTLATAFYRCCEIAISHLKLEWRCRRAGVQACRRCLRFTARETTRPHRGTMPTTSREIRLASRPQGVPSPDNFSFATVEVPDPGPGDVLVRNLCMSVDPYMRGRMNDVKSYVPPFEIGKALQGGAVGRVIASNDEKLPVGSPVLSMYGWREAFVAPASQVQVVDVSVASPSAYLGMLGVTGMTAWVGLFRIAALKGGETVFISGGAGAVGSAACQLAKMHGCRVLASASSAEKVAYLR